MAYNIIFSNTEAANVYKAKFSNSAKIQAELDGICREIEKSVAFGKLSYSYSTIGITDEQLREIKTALQKAGYSVTEDALRLIICIHL